MAPYPPRRRRQHGRSDLRALLLLCVVLLIPVLGRGEPNDTGSGGIGVGLGSFLSPGPLSEPHAHLEGITLCTECHTAGEGVTAGQCMSCHDGVRKQVEQRTGFHKGKGETCTECHPDHRGRAFDMVRFTEAEFDHEQTGFSLTGAHQEASCSSCHVEIGEWTGLTTECSDCHDDNHGGKAGDRGLLDTCESCHDTAGWDALPIASHVFAHKAPQEAAFGLEGAHAEAQCTACHADWHFTPVAHEACTDCHDNPHRMSVGECTSCHKTPHAWTVRGFDHDLTGFTLQGVHTEATCRSCHGRSTTRRLPHEACSDCHEDVHSGQFAPRDCDSCHSVDLAGFGLQPFDHARTDFPILGEHADVACEACHGDGPDAVFSGVAHEDCDSCHDDQHEGHFEPTACSTCHSETGWQVDDFDHDRTDFPLIGEHIEAECSACHGESDWSGVAHDTCMDCHRDDDPHKGSFEAESCATCHHPASWERITFDHAASTPFDLAPAHTERTCSDCHDDKSVFTGLESQCTACHAQTRPSSHYEGECTDCHSGAHWTPASLGSQEHDITGFSLTGAHGQAACRSCHAPELPFGSVPSTCVGCHMADDAHQHQLGDRCDDCHQPSSWVRTRWRHHRTGWPLRGQHRLASCTDCHATGYVGTPTQCWRCHETDAPPSIAAHNPLSPCDECHVPHAWEQLRTFSRGP